MELGTSEKVFNCRKCLAEIRTFRIPVFLDSLNFGMQGKRKVQIRI